MKNEIKLVQSGLSPHAPWRLPGKRTAWLCFGEPVLCADAVTKYVDLPRNVKGIVLVFSNTSGPAKFKFTQNSRLHKRAWHPWTVWGTNRVPLYHEMDNILEKQSAMGNTHFHFEYK